MIILDKEKLKQVSLETTSEEVLELKLVSRLKEASKTAWTEGCGLAAIQIGVPVRFAWYTFGGKEFVLLNPKVTKSSGKCWLKEGCLSLPKFYTFKERAYEIEYTSAGVSMKAEGHKARIIQHEIDHMDGVLLS